MRTHNNTHRETHRQQTPPCAPSEPHTRERRRERQERKRVHSRVARPASSNTHHRSITAQTYLCGHALARVRRASYTGDTAAAALRTSPTHGLNATDLASPLLQCGSCAPLTRTRREDTPGVTTSVTTAWSGAGRDDDGVQIGSEAERRFGAGRARHRRRRQARRDLAQEIG